MTVAELSALRAVAAGRRVRVRDLPPVAVSPSRKVNRVGRLLAAVAVGDVFRTAAGVDVRWCPDGVKPVDSEDLHRLLSAGVVTLDPTTARGESHWSVLTKP